MSADLRFYMAVFWRRLPLFILVSGLISGVALALALTLPTIYTSSARLLVESPQIPDELAQTTVQTNASEQLELVEQRLMTRANLIEIAQQLDVFENIREISPDEVVRTMRAQTLIQKTSGRDRATLMQISFDHDNARTSAEVVNEYVTRILDENARRRIGVAGSTLEFFESQVQRLSTELDLLGARVLEFKNANTDALPDSLDYRLGRQALLQERQAQIGREKATLADQKNQLIQVFNSTGQIQIETNARQTLEERQLAQAREEMAGLLAIYSDQNPRVRILRARIEALEAQVLAQEGVAAGNGTEAASLLDIQIAGIDGRIEALDEQAAQVAEELETIGDTIARTPGNAITLEALERDYENVQAQYNNAVAQLARASAGEQIELLSKGQRIAVIEQAVVPTEPSRPNRPLIAGGGIAAGIMAGLGLILLLELLNRAVRRPADLTNALGITPLATLPYVQTTGETVRRRGSTFLLLLAGIAVVTGALYYVDTEILPLELLFDRLLDKIGL